MSNQKVSIVIPTYNSIDFIQRTIKSVEDQTYKNYELIIINDGSTDGTGEFLDNYKINKNNVIIFHQENKGVSSARNKGIELSNGELICFLDSDDLYDKFFLEKMILSSSNHSENYDAFCCQFYIERKGKKRKKEVALGEKLTIEDFMVLCKNGSFIHLSNFLIKKSFIINNSIKFDIEQKLTEDVLFLFNIFLNGNIKPVHEYLFTYKYREDSTINTLNDQKRKNEMEGWIKAKLLIKNDINLQDKEKILIIIDAFLMKFLIYMYKNNLKEFNLNKAKKTKSIIKQYIELNKINIDNYSKSEKRIIKYMRSNSYLKLITGCIYYKYIRK